jgi:uncharacterized SAM-binding protein YcdF (DUF218 family)
MSGPEPKSSKAGAPAGPPEPPPALGPRRVLPTWVKRSAAGLALTLLLVFGIGFLWFCWRVPRDEIVLARGADGIVVVTGGASRIADAIELLSAGRGQRLLISGVHPSTTGREIARLMPEYGPLIACCVDLDHSAVNTVGNAIETRNWTRERGFRSLIVVTSNYHMPRTMAELAWHMPNTELIPFPVVTERMRSEPWWSSESTRLLLAEYLKFVFAQVRMRFEPAPTVTDVGSGRSHA